MDQNSFISMFHVSQFSYLLNFKIKFENIDGNIQTLITGEFKCNLVRVASEMCYRSSVIEIIINIQHALVIALRYDYVISLCLLIHFSFERSKLLINIIL